ncbi:uncharacterized protein L969DRAFT_49725 [Mixia osmundae IAM 14324]|uniref:PITH domain-containing protein n=1 Tax=Mixia osmundae (strain CBS 9802 / IAM 14324 / JCM 22182 / KY 12970) TaxID=764103 RepID=G7E6T8_MIXOS|nr:uncharacterized protein L969DRAFT_49725 [Mixia osmundae IAM 14324]KEI39069.1 hypothetical protein L969DRAFT_49725 [Mixia osmundae IAM 14324]GAA98548.1 hypothetical protein E5Q_05235 [Mixia osmundae IAM 14324]
MSITLLPTKEAYDNLVRSKSDSVIIIDFHATWCGPCKMIAPAYQQLAHQYPLAIFTKCDVDANRTLAQAFRVSAMPTFVITRHGATLSTVRGADRAGLESAIKAALATAAAGPSASGSGSADSLMSNIDAGQASCLNIDTKCSLRSFVAREKDRYIESDADEQLLLHLPMTRTTKIRAIKLTTASEHASKAPKEIKLFVNRPELGFDDAENEEGAQSIELTEAQASGKEEIELRFVRFANVTHLSIFVSSNQGNEDTTLISSLDILGTPEGSTAMDVASLRKQQQE